MLYVLPNVSAFGRDGEAGVIYGLNVVPVGVILGSKQRRILSARIDFCQEEGVRYVMMIMKRVFMMLLAAMMITAGAYGAEAAGVGGRWLLDGGGFAEKGILRVSLTANGDMDIIASKDASGTEKITEYRLRGELNASRLNINTWKYSGTMPVNPPITVNNFNPTINEPFRLPSFTIQELTYTVELTSATAGTIKIRGYVDIDKVGKCEINADCALWKEGSDKPAVPNSKSGCNSGAGAALAVIAASWFFLRKRREL